MLSLLDGFSELLQELIRQTGHFTRDKQAQILGIRDKEIKEWYDILNPASKVGYEKMVPGTDSIELQARSFSKIIMAAPNLSACQLNCLGLAIYLACATRTGSPHRMLLFDDPIQSMDDEHTETFKLEVLRKLLDEGFQVVLLTHLDNFAEGVEKLYRSSAEAALYRMQTYEESGPVIEFKGPELRRLLDEVRRNKDSDNEGFRKQATQALRKFEERFVKDFHTAETGKPLSKRFANENWSRLRDLLRLCKKFDPSDEQVLEATHDFTSPYLHSDDTAPSKVPTAGHINPHYKNMKTLMEKYTDILKIS